MAISLPLARALVFQHLQTLRQHPRPVGLGIIAVDRAVRARAEAQHIDVSWNAAGEHLEGYDSVNVRAAVEELVAAGVLVYGVNALGPSLALLQITEFGLACVEAGQVDPHDADAYLASVLGQAPNLDAVARQYLEEGLECLRRRCYRASAVMLGAASETVMLALISAFHHALQDPQRKQQFEDNAMKPAPIRRRFDYFRQRLAAVQAQHVPAALREDLDLKLDGVFALLRAARNDAGHPNIGPVSRETIHGNYLLFPSYCARAYALIEHFAQNPIP